MRIFVLLLHMRCFAPAHGVYLGPADITFGRWFLVLISTVSLRLLSIPILYSGLYIRQSHDLCHACDGVAIMRNQSAIWAWTVRGPWDRFVHGTMEPFEGTSSRLHYP